VSLATASGRALPSGAGRSVPRHVAIIMDGNGRWAKKRLLPRIAGHQQGVEAVRRAVQAASRLGIEVLTLYAFSSENWKRPVAEVSDLMGLLRHYLRNELAELHGNGVRLQFIGDHSRFSADVTDLIDRATSLTAGNSGLRLVVALNYGSHDEIVRATRAIALKVRTGLLDPDAITPDAIEAELDTASLPQPDLIIRTSGEQRLSNFLLWQAAYAELVFLDVLWPDFDASALESAISAFAQRERRFGGL
jgi:undecaprenyl diphosphate synthase